MKLTQSQLEQYDAQGYLVLPNLLSADEVQTLRDGLSAAVGVQDERVLREKSSDAIRMLYDMHNPAGPVASPAQVRARTTSTAAPTSRTAAPRERRAASVT